MTAKWVEIYEDSRGFTIDRQNISKDFVFVVYEDDGTESFADNVVGPAYFDGIEMFLDDDVIHYEVMRKIRGYIPLYFEFVISNSKIFILFISTCRVTQLHWGAWEVRMTFDIPENNNQQPKDDEQPDELTNEFVQIAFNGSAEERKIQSALVTECTYSKDKYATWLAAPAGTRGPAPTIPYLPDTKCLIGHSKDGIEGAQIFGRHFSFQIIQYMSPQKLKSAYVRKLTRMITCLNDRDFFGFAAGSIMFKGYQAQGDLFQNVPVTFEFDHRPNFLLASTTPTTLADPEDQRDSNGRLVTTDQYDIIAEPSFASTWIGDGQAGLVPNFTAPGEIKEAVLAATHATAFSTTADNGTLAGFHWPYEGIGRIIGVHSGWSIISYLYEAKIDVNVGSNLLVPSYRVIYQPYEYTNFRDLDL